jgi:hypothetical protein
MIMAVENSGELASVAEEYSLARTKLQYAYYGLDYDEMMNGSDEEENADGAVIEESGE